MTPPDSVEHYPRFTSRTYVDNIEASHFRAYWHNRDPNSLANAEVRLTPVLKGSARLFDALPTTMSSFHPIRCQQP